MNVMTYLDTAVATQGHIDFVNLLLKTIWYSAARMDHVDVIT
jgi:hypothetical protein